MNLRSEYGPEGPLGFPMPDKAARAVEAILKGLPKGREFEFRRRSKAESPEVDPGERSDVSWITTEAVDHTKEVVIAKGMDDSQFAGNPVVTLCHSYYDPPVARSLWRKRVKRGETVGVKAKTLYPGKPTSWPDGEPWPPDKVFGYVQAGLLVGKSVGILPTKVHFPDAQEAGKNGWPSDVLVIDEWLLLEYAVCSLPMNPEALTEQVSKSGPVPEWLRKAAGWPEPAPEAPPTLEAIPYTTWSEVEKVVNSRVAGLDWAGMTDRAVSAALDKARGRV